MGQRRDCKEREWTSTRGSDREVRHVRTRVPQPRKNASSPVAVPWAHPNKSATMPQVTTTRMKRTSDRTPAGRDDWRRRRVKRCERRRARQVRSSTPVAVPWATQKMGKETRQEQRERKGPQLTRAPSTRVGRTVVGAGAKEPVQRADRGARRSSNGAPCTPSLGTAPSTQRRRARGGREDRHETHQRRGTSNRPRTWQARAGGTRGWSAWANEAWKVSSKQRSSGMMISLS